MGAPNFKSEDDLAFVGLLQKPAFVVDGQGVIVAVNQAAAILFNLPQHSMLEESLTSIGHFQAHEFARPTDQGQHLKSFAALLMAQIQCEVRLVGPAGEEVLDLIGLGEGEKSAHYLGILRAKPAAPPVHAEEAQAALMPAKLPAPKAKPLTQKQQVLEDAIGAFCKQSLLGDLSGTLVHEVNNSLGVAIGFADLMSENSSKLVDVFESAYPKFFRHLAKILEALTRISSSVDYFGKIYRLDERNHKRFCVDDVLARAMGLFEQQFAGRRITLNVMYDEKPGYLNSSPAVFEQIVLILCIRARNALTGVYERRGGSLRVFLKVAAHEIILEYEDDAKDAAVYDQDLLSLIQTDVASPENLAIPIVKQLVARIGGRFEGGVNTLGGYTSKIFLPRNG